MGPSGPANQAGKIFVERKGGVFRKPHHRQNPTFTLHREVDLQLVDAQGSCGHISLAGGPKRMEKILKFRNGPGDKMDFSLIFLDFLAEIPRGTERRPRPIIWYHSQP